MSSAYFTNKQEQLVKLLEKYNIDIKFIKFLFVGVLNTLFGYGIFSLFIFLKLYYPIAALLAMVIGIIFNFKTTGTLVFKNKENSLLPKFFGVYGIGYLVNIGLLAIFDYFKFSMYVAQAIIILPMALLSFCLMKYFVFNKKEL